MIDASGVNHLCLVPAFDCLITIRGPFSKLPDIITPGREKQS